MIPSRQDRLASITNKQKFERLKKSKSDAKVPSSQPQSKPASSTTQRYQKPAPTSFSATVTKKCRSETLEKLKASENEALATLQHAIANMNESAKQYNDMETDGISQAGGEQDEVKLLNVPSVWEQGVKKIAKEVNKLTVQKILEVAQETDINRVYEVDLHGQKVAVIQHFDKFKKLRVLDLSCNIIENIDNLHKNTDLRELRLYDNSITLICNLDSLKELVNLFLHSNRIDRIGKGLLHLRKLKTLRLDSNYIFSLDKRELASLGQLTYLDLSNNRLGDISALTCLPCLEELVVKGNKLSRVADLHQCTELKEVDLSNNRLEDLSGLKSLPRLTIVNVSENRLASLRSLGKLKCLQELDASLNKLTEMSSVPELFPNVEILNVSQNQVSDFEELCSLRNLHHLVELEVHHNPALVKEDGAGQRADHMTHLLTLMPNLEMLDGTFVKLRKTAAGASANSVAIVPLTPRSSTPLMRPMTPATVVSSKQMEGQISDIKHMLEGLEKQFISSVEHLKTEIASKLPEKPSKQASQDGSSPDSRPISSRRMRLVEAVKWAAVNRDEYDEDEDDSEVF